LRRIFLLQHDIEGKIEGRIEVTRIRGRRLKQLLADLNETIQYRKLKKGSTRSLSLCLSLCGELGLEEGMELSKDRQQADHNLLFSLTMSLQG
jgi:hypothetical protein